VTIQPYLYFAGRTEEAITFYQKVLGAELQKLLSFKDSPDPAPPGIKQGHAFKLEDRRVDRPGVGRLRF
jgi:uncharacterized glyoxalase superfamily protein PhnB